MIEEQLRVVREQLVVIQAAGLLTQVLVEPVPQVLHRVVRVSSNGPNLLALDALDEHLEVGAFKLRRYTITGTT